MNIIHTDIHPHFTPASIIGIIWYRIKKHPGATLFSAFFTIAMVWLLSFIVGEIYPDFKSYYKKLFSIAGIHHCIKYNFYSGEDSGVYSAIGRAVTNHTIMVKKNGTSRPQKIGLFRDHDTLVNCPTGGGFENFMKVSAEKNSFGLVQGAVLNLQDEELRKGILVETPLFMERLHVFYRKDLFQKRSIRPDEMQLSANTDPRILACIAGSVKTIQVGITGSCTHIFASDVMDLLKQQIIRNSTNKTFIPGYQMIASPLSNAMAHMQQDTVIDMMFLVGADPTEDI